VIRRYLTVGALRKALEGASDDLPVLVAGGPDHSYRTMTGSGVTTVAVSQNRGRESFAEWAGPENASPGEKPAPAFVVGG